MSDDIRERLAALAHEQWSGWMQYLFDQSVEVGDGRVELPAWAVERWRRQMQTPYAELPEAEKASDRTEANRVLAVIAAREAATYIIRWFNDQVRVWWCCGEEINLPMTPEIARAHVLACEQHPYAQLRHFVEDLAAAGVRFDPNPTMDLSQSRSAEQALNQAVTTLYNYIHDIDSSVRLRARQALEAAHGTGE